MALSAVGGLDTSQPFVAKLLQALGMVETTGLRTWGALILAVAATLATILHTYKLAGFISRHADGSREPLRLISGNGSVNDDAGVCINTLSDETDRASEQDEPEATPRLTDASDSDWITKGRLRLEEEDPMEGVGNGNWDFSNDVVVKLWPQGIYFRGGDRTIPEFVFINNYQRTPVGIITENGDIRVCDGHASCESPVMSTYKLGLQNPISEIGYQGTGKLMVRCGGSRSDVSICDLRMLGPNGEGRASPMKSYDCRWWEEDAVIVPNEFEHSSENEFQIVGNGDSLEFPEWNWSRDGMNSRSMVFRCLNAVRFISSGTRN